MVEGGCYSGILTSNGTDGTKKEVNHFNDDQNKIQVNEKTDIITEEFPNLDNALVTEEISDHSSEEDIQENGAMTNHPSIGHSEIGISRSEIQIEEDAHVELVKSKEKVAETSDHSSEEAIQENGAITNHPSNVHTEIGIARSEIQIEEDARVELVKSKEEVAEIDLKKILDEQETHDLYCPNCNSCITKRVILRKRKRTIQGTHYDAPPAKIQQRQPPIASADELTELGLDAEPDVFRCLSCFSFFIPTASGFNIYRIFGRRGETENQLTSALSPANIGNISSPISKQVGITNTTSGSGLSRHNDSFIASVQQTGETSTNDQSYPVTSTSDSVSYGQNQITTEKNDAGSSFSIFRIFRSRETKTLRSAQAAEVTGGSFSSPLAKTDQANKPVSGLQLPGGSTHFTPQQMSEQFMGIQTSPGDQLADMFGKDLFFKEKESPEVTAISGAGNSEGQSTIGEKDAVYRESHNTDGKQVNDSRSSMQDNLDKMKSEGRNLAKSQIMTDDMLGTTDFIKTTSRETTSQTSQTNGSVQPATTVSTRVETQIYIGEQSAGVAGRRDDLDVLKSIVYGGLLESVTSLCVVSAAAGSDASTLNIVALGLANLIGGLFVIAHDLSDLISNREKENKKSGVPVGRYWELLGRKANYRMHAFIAVLTYILVGLLPPVIYGFTFRKSDNKEYKLVVVAAASLVCIFFLAIGKAHVNAQRTYFKTLSYYISLGIGASGLSYVAGIMIDRLLVQLGLFENTAVAPVPPSSIYNVLASTQGVWASS